MTDLVVEPAKRGLHGSVPAPVDKSVLHRALLLAGLATGSSRVRLPSAMGADNRATLDALRSLGVEVREGEREIVLEGGGLHGLRPPSGPIDCGNSGTTLRLLAGVLAGQRFQSTLVGDASLSRRPMERIARPLRLRGARIEGALDPRKVGEITPPLVVGPLPEPHVLSELEHESAVPSAQVKSAVLLSGLYAAGPTLFREPVLSRDHTERMLVALGVPLRAVGPMLALDALAWDGVLPSFDVEVPGDPSAAAFVLAAALLVPGSRVEVRGVCANPTRMGFFDALRAMGADVWATPRGEQMNEPVAVLGAAHGALTSTSLGGELVVRAIDELPVLAALAARARGVTVISDAAELRAKESDRIATTTAMLRAFGVSCEERPDGLAIEGRPDEPLVAARVESHGDHRIAMASVVLALAARGPSRVVDAGPIATSFPRFVGTLRGLGASIAVAEAEAHAAPRHPEEPALR